jgi:phosphoribosylformimino-5-aminoimidazole carboxamide ribotide isomerase
MRLIGVIDLCAGRAVHARGGRRDRYRPIRSVAGVDIGGDPEALARLYVQRFGLGEIYIADLDAIAGESLQAGSIGAIAAAGADVWLDAGIRTTEEALVAFGAGASRVIVGLETLRSFSELGAVIDASGSERVAFSLDLREGAPIVLPGAEIGALEPESIARRAATAGATTIIVLDLARVGSGRGVDFELLASIRAAAPDVQLLVGGGIRGPDDVSRLRQLGCEGVLVASALHDGRLNAGYSNVTR